MRFFHMKMRLPRDAMRWLKRATKHEPVYNKALYHVGEDGVFAEAVVEAMAFRLAELEGHGDAGALMSQAQSDLQNLLQEYDEEVKNAQEK